MGSKLSTTHIGLGRDGGLGDIQSTSGSHDSKTVEMKVKLYKAESYHESLVNPRRPRGVACLGVEGHVPIHKLTMVRAELRGLASRDWKRQTRSRCLSLKEYRVF